MQGFYILTPNRNLVNEMYRQVFDSKESKKKYIKRIILVFSLTLLLLCSGVVQAQSSKKSGWEIIESNTEVDITNIISTIGENVWSFGNNGLMMKSIDKGKNWNILDNVTNEDIISSDYSNEILVFVGKNGTVFQKDTNDLWENISIIDSSMDLKGVAISSEDLIYVIGDKNSLWKYDNKIWENISNDNLMNYNSISFIDSNDGLNGVIVGDRGLILTTLDSGYNWNLIEPPESIKNSNIISVELYSESKAYATTEDGYILVSRNLDTSIGFEWDLVLDERLPIGAARIENIDVINSIKIIVTGTNNYVATSKDGGNTFERHNLSLLPSEGELVIRDIEMIDGFCGIITGNYGLILITADNEYGCTEGLDQSVGFEIEEFNKFGTFVEKYAPWMLDGLIATMKIVGFGILFGFIIGIFLAMCKTAPTSLKDMIESHLENVIFFSWIMIPFCILISRYYASLKIGLVSFLILLIALKILKIYFKNNKLKQLSDQEGFFGIIIPQSKRLFWTRILGLSLMIGIPDTGIIRIRGGILMIIESIDSFMSLGLNGFEYVYSPVGDPIAFSYLIMGFGLLIPGILLSTTNGKYSDIFIPFLNNKKIKFKPWEIRPLNSLATLYTDMFRNTPLVVQFLFLHFGIEIGKRLEQFGSDMFQGIPYLADIFSDRIYLSAICALAMNSGAYQCETLRGAIAAIPSGQMEAGRSIGLTYLQTMRLIILPQSIRICIPPLGNEMVNLVLNSSLAMVIGYTELTRQGKLINAITFQITWTWGMVMISYFIVTWALAMVLRRIEVKTRIPGLGIV